MSDAEAVIRKHADAAIYTMLCDLLAHATELVELAVERATSIGAAEYGDASFHKTPLELRRDRFEEHADAIFYASVELDQLE